MNTNIPPPLRIEKRIMEADVEKRLVVEVKKREGICWKFTSPNRRSVPDRICIFPGGIVIFVEAKRPGQKPTSNQLEKHRLLRSVGAWVEVVDSYESIDSVMATYDDMVKGFI